MEKQIITRICPFCQNDQTRLIRFDYEEFFECQYCFKEWFLQDEEDLFDEREFKRVMTLLEQRYGRKDFYLPIHDYWQPL